MTRRDSALALLVITLWGTNFLVIHWGLTDLPPFTLLAARFSFVVIPAVFFVKRPNVPWRRLLAIGATTSLGQFSLVYLALRQGLPVGLAPLLLQVQVFVTVALAAQWLGDIPTRRQLAGMTVGALGLTVVGVSRAQQASWVPFALAILAGCSWAIGNVLTRHASQQALQRGHQPPSGTGLVVWSGIVVPIPAMALSLLTEQNELADLSIPYAGLASAACTAVLSTHIGYGLWNNLLARNPPSALGPYALGIPIVGLLAALAVLGEIPTQLEMVGGILVFGGLVLALQQHR